MLLFSRDQKRVGFKVCSSQENFRCIDVSLMYLLVKPGGPDGVSSIWYLWLKTLYPTSKPDFYISLLKCSYLDKICTICSEILQSESQDYSYFGEENRIQIQLLFAELWSIRFHLFFRMKTLLSKCAFNHVASWSFFWMSK